jgi:cold-inducible RNA-binding protein
LQIIQQDSKGSEAVRSLENQAALVLSRGKMETKIYVGNLPFSATEEELKTLFSQAGTVTSVAVIMDKFSGRSRGFGFVEMSTPEETQAAITKFNEYQMGDRALRVNLAKPREEKPRKY